VGPQEGKLLLHVFILEKICKNHFSRTSGSISIKLNTTHICIKGIQVCTIQGLGPLQRGRYSQKCKNRVGLFNFFPSRTSGPEKVRFTQKLPDVVSIEIY
jgi:hypothetical protein